MLVGTIVTAVVALVLLGLAYSRGVAGPGLLSGLHTFLLVLPLLAAVFAISGLIEVLVPKERVAALLGDQTGFRGIALGCVAGAITPGGPYVSFPIVASIYHAGAGVGTVVAFITAWSLWAVSRLPLEVGFLGPRLTLVRVLSTVIFPPIAGLIARWLFSGWVR